MRSKVRVPRTTALVTAALTIFFVSRVSTQSRPVEELKPRYRASAQAVAAADLAALAAVYVVDGTFEMRSSNANDRVRGHEGISAQWQSILRSGVASVTVTTAKARLEAAAIVEEGTFVMQRKDKSVCARGHYTATWHRDAGAWRLARHALVAE